MIFRNKRSKVTGHNKTKLPFAAFTKSRLRRYFRRFLCGRMRNNTWLDMKLAQDSQLPWLGRCERALEEPGRLECAAVARKASDDLRAQRQTVGGGQPRHVDAGRTERRP